MPEKETPSQFGDRPIEDVSQDRFRRQPFAELLARQIVALPGEDSHVIGLLGSWGSGKTSIINLASKVLEQNGIAVVHFNPWLFSTAEQLTTSFFKEVAAQLTEDKDKKWQALGRKLGDYGDALTPLKGLPGIGAYLSAGAEALKKGGGVATKKGRGLTGSVYDQKKQIETLLRDTAQRVVVVIDDLDRLEAREIREIMRLVRSTADFPYVSYLLAFDRERVGKAVTDNPAEGDAYLEKIVQLTFDVPQVRQADLRRFFVEELQRVVGNRELAPLDETDWQNAYHEVIARLIQSPRDVRRVMNVLPFALDVAGSEVAPVDLITLEVVRVTMPTVFALLPEFADMLTGVDAPKWSRQGPSPLTRLLEALPERKDVVERLCARLFPATRQYIDNVHYGDRSQKLWRRQRKVAHPEVFRFFFEKSLPEDVLSAHAVRHVVESLTAPEKLDRMLGGMNGEELENMLGRLEDYEEEFPSEAAGASIPILYKHASRLREGRRAMFEFGADMALSSIVLRLLRRVPDADRAETVRTILSNTPALTRRVGLLQMVGSNKGIGHSLLRDEDVRPLEKALYDETLAASASNLAGERDLVAIVYWMYSRIKPPDEVATWLRERIAEPSFLIALLRSSLSEVMSHGLGESAVLREDSLPWDFLEAALSSEGIARIDGLSTKGLNARSARAVEVAKKYRTGWRPAIGSREGDEDSHDPVRKAAWLLMSGVYKQRMDAITVLHGAVVRGAALPEDAQGQLARIVLSSAYSTDERVAGVDLLVAGGKIDGVLKDLSNQWLTEKTVAQALSTRMGLTWLKRPERIPDLIALLEALPLNTEGKRVATVGVVDAYATLCDLIEHDATALSSEAILRAREIGATFSANEQLERRLQKLHRLIDGQPEKPKQL